MTSAKLTLRHRQDDQIIQREKEKQQYKAGHSKEMQEKKPRPDTNIGPTNGLKTLWVLKKVCWPYANRTATQQESRSSMLTAQKCPDLSAR